MTPVRGGQPKVEYVTPLDDDEDRLYTYYDDKPLRYRTVTNIISNGTHRAKRCASSLSYT